MVSASKASLLDKVARGSLRAVLWRAAGWTSGKLSAAVVLGLGFIWMAADRLPPLLATAAPAAPVEVVRTLPVPYLDEGRPEPPSRPSVREAPARVLQVVARRAEERRRARREAESREPGKADEDDKARAAPPPPPAASPPAASAGAKLDQSTDPKAQAPADPKAAAARSEPAEPDTWSDTEIIAALRDCLRKLAPLGVDIEIAEPVKEQRCGAPAPVVVRRIGLGGTRVELQPPPTLNCAMVASLGTWIEKTLQPAAQEHLGSPIVRIRNLSGYACRKRIGTAFQADRLSEHAMANAIDIAAFVTADGRTVEVLRQWGPTARELRDDQERAWSAAQDAKVAAKAAESEAALASKAAAKAERDADRSAARKSRRDQAKAEAARLKEEAARLKAEAERKREDAARKKDEAQQKEAEWRKVLAQSAELQKLGRGVDDARAEKRGRPRRTADARGGTASAIGSDDRAVSGGFSGTSALPPEWVFLRRLHRGACGTFGTVLGPDANEAHRNHFHFDLAPRKRSAFCE